ncbi:hypothetical protein N658DRAFT_137750 [Parathielavia hyrcaniae]|uniref:Uncharacterized protein n=1 Tax=Parathielavia hyrcaniae TaxID=113614 RepID=A0AAN6QAG3_9PEZI|nr:hypothetical protein N658DRAFT_137750 [Parathielavia hyrcaniae]
MAWVGFYLLLGRGYGRTALHGEGSWLDITGDARRGYAAMMMIYGTIYDVLCWSWRCTQRAGKNS